MRGSAMLAAGVTLIWVLVYLGTQVFADPALPMLPTLGLGLGLTVAAVLGYPSALRGPPAGVVSVRSPPGRSRSAAGCATSPRRGAPCRCAPD
ncbi:hypothetical protein BG28_12970 [Nesterenkonia sp. AN1]|uniref:hypothetical protein n=1 Tax=Nesterenkonia sp. AN1 TaxID=652017 RepID=UPI0004502586|nr:hypothetical protein [Nesterenkonia sp. AN1]EXF25626.1 hypothetical protein BG28_12970 [Nesterenkonia sp. AN1]